MKKTRYQPSHCHFRVAQTSLIGLHPSLDEILTGSLRCDKSFGLLHPVNRGRKLDGNWITVYQPLYLSLFSPGEGQGSIFLLHTAEKQLIDLIKGFFPKRSPVHLFGTFPRDGMRGADKPGAWTADALIRRSCHLHFGLTLMGSNEEIIMNMYN